MKTIHQGHLPVRTFCSDRYGVLYHCPRTRTKRKRPAFADTTKRHIERIRQTD